MRSAYRILLGCSVMLTLVSCEWLVRVFGPSDNTEPGPMALLWPYEDAVGLSLRPEFGWTISADEDGDDVTYVIYCDSNNPPSAVLGTTTNAELEANGLLTGSYTPESDLSPNTTYRWRVKATDGQGGETYSSMWASGSGVAGFADAQFNYPFGVALDSSGNVYVGDGYNHRIRKVAP
ncbi:MAG: hypothetical protein AB1798_10290 [Spirochaetota bacterium]